jgi:sugar phosphate isomerase/epimerase
MNKRTRRQFVMSGLAMVGAPAMLFSRKTAQRLPISFSTLGCPQWDWKRILNEAAKSGYSGIELRGLQGEMDLTKRPEFAGSGLSQSLKDLEAVGLRIVNLGSSVRLHEKEPTVRASQMEEGRHFIDLAHQLHSPYVRVFGDKWVEGEPRAETLARMTAGLRELGEYASKANVTVILESHGDFADSPTLLQILKGAESPSTGLLWDTHHTVVIGKEAPEKTFSQLGSYVRHTHIKDSKPQGDDVRYVLTGTGTIPLQEIVNTLVKGRYKGFFSFEWEKAWHPEIKPPETAIPQFAEAMKDYLSKAGFRAG